MRAELRKRNGGAVALACFALAMALVAGCDGSVGTPDPNAAAPSARPRPAGDPDAGDLATRVKDLLKAELEKELGPLEDSVTYDKREMYGRVVACDYRLPEGTRLDDGWGDRVVAALGRLGITAEYDGGEVRAENQKIAGEEFTSLQFTTQRGLEEPDVLGATLMFPAEMTD